MNLRLQELFSHCSNVLIKGKRTMVSVQRFQNAGHCVFRAIDERVSGDIVECGVWKGGTLAYMAKVSQAFGDQKHVYGFDTFSGIPKPSQHDGQQAAGRGKAGDLYASTEDSVESFNLIGASMKNVSLVKGDFRVTVPQAAQVIKGISVLRLDGDWYESTKVCLDHLYDLVSHGGYIIIDDYGHWSGCRKAVDEFRTRMKITAPLERVDYTEVFWKKQ